MKRQHENPDHERAPESLYDDVVEFAGSLFCPAGQSTKKDAPNHKSKNQRDAENQRRRQQLDAVGTHELKQFHWRFPRPEANTPQKKTPLRRDSRTPLGPSRLPGNVSGQHGVDRL